MIEDLTSDSIANNIWMLRDGFQGTIVVVEGDTDLTFFKRLLHRECAFVIALNKDNALQIMRILDLDSREGIIAIVDADFWALEGIEPPSQNIVHTDSHDVETMLISSPALEKVLDEFGSASKITTFVSSNDQSIRDVLLERATPIGYLRWISLLDGHGLKFDGLVYKSFIEYKDDKLLISEDKLIRVLLSRSQEYEIKDEMLRQRLANIRDGSHDLWQVCCGHDLVQILSLLLKKVLGTRNTREVAPELHEKSLRLAYEFASFQTSELFSSIQSWERATGYRVI